MTSYNFNMLRLFIKQKMFKILDHYPIYDEFDKIHYNVDQKFSLIKIVFNISDPFEQELFTIENKLFNFIPTFFINYSNGETITVKKRITFFKTVINVISNRYNITLKGDFFNHNFTIYENDEEIAYINKKISFKDSYCIDIYNEKYQDILVALVIIVDCIMDMSRNN